MKNYWLDCKIPKKSKVKIWLSSSITGKGEELIGEIDRDEVFIQEKSQWYGDPSRLSIPEEMDKMLWDLQISNAITIRDNTYYDVKTNVYANAIKNLPVEFKQAQWAPPTGCMFIIDKMLAWDANLNNN